MSYCAHERKMLIIPIPVLAGAAVAGNWNDTFKEWKQVHMSDFLKITSGFMEELEGPESKPRVAIYESLFQQSDNSSMP